MEYEHLLAYMETLWYYLPYIIYVYVFLTLLPKSLCRIKRFADADYDSNRGKYHRCYAPDICCHALYQDESCSSDTQPKPKQRKAVTRVYPKRQLSGDATKDPSSVSTLPHLPIKRQVPTSAIQTRTNVNLIARMFESGNAAIAAATTSPSSKKINRVTPTIVPEIRAGMYAEQEQDRQARDQRKGSVTHVPQYLLHENIENSANLLNQLHTSSSSNNNNNNNNSAEVLCEVEKLHNGHHDSDWNSEPLTAPIPQRRKRNAPPSSLNFTAGGSSATPSTASPAASSPHSSSPDLTSPIFRHAPLNMSSSLEDIFEAIARNAEKPENFIYAGCKSLSPVTSIDDILSQRRLSRPLSAYSISDLLNDENSNSSVDETYVENFLRVLNNKS